MYLQMHGNSGKLAFPRYALGMAVSGQGDGSVVSSQALEMMMQVSVGNPVDTVSRAEAVTRRFEAAISIGILNYGDHLPPEALLAEQLGVSPLTLRHGLHMLRNKGLVEIRRGRGGGSFISGQVDLRDRDVDDRLRNAETDEVRDLYDLAAVTARGAVRLSVLRADDQDLRRLRLRNEQFFAEQSSAGLRRAAGRFHVGLGVAAQSRQLTSLLIRIQADIAPISWPSAHIASRKKAAYEEHEAIISSIAASDAVEAESRVTEYFTAEQLLAVERHLRLLSEESEER